jgi:hypothetical protein
VKSSVLCLRFSTSSELEKSSLEKPWLLRAAHALGQHLLELLLLIPEAVLLVIALVAGVIPIVVVVLVGGVDLLPLGALSDEVGGVTALEAAPR